MTHILTPIGRRPLVKINETAEQVADTHINIELDLGHFYNYVMENFPELTEEYIDENYEQVDELSNKTLGSYVKKARKDQSYARSHVWSHGVADAVRQRTLALMAKRKAGIGKAVDRLTKD